MATDAQRDRWTEDVTKGALAAVEAVRLQMATAVEASSGGWNPAELFRPSWWEQSIDRFVVPKLERVGGSAIVAAGQDLGLGEVVAEDGWVEAMADTIAGQRGVLVDHAVFIAERVTVLAERANDDGWSPSKVADALGVATEYGALVAAAGPVSDGLAEGIGMTEAHTLIEYAPLVLWIAAGLGGSKTWVCTFQQSRESHILAHEQTVPVAEPFVLGDSVIGQYPGDWALPGEERVHCRCLMALTAD